MFAQHEMKLIGRMEALQSAGYPLRFCHKDANLWHFMQIGIIRSVPLKSPKLLKLGSEFGLG